jgi:hypothetical protein
MAASGELSTASKLRVSVDDHVAPALAVALLALRPLCPNTTLEWTVWDMSWRPHTAIVPVWVITLQSDGGLTMSEANATRVYFTIGREVGLVGRWLRLILGTVFIASVAWNLLVLRLASIAVLAEVALYFALSLAVYTAAYHLLGERILARLNPWIGAALFVGPPLAVALLQLGPVPFRQGLTLYVGVSLIITFFLHYGGCEVVSIPMLILGRRYTVYCPLNAVDLVERRLRTKAR